MIDSYGRCSGNVLFLILIAVAAFAALSYVVAQSSRSGVPDTGNENLALETASMLDFAGKLRLHTQKMLLRGVSAENIKLHPAGASYAPCTNEPNCVFNVADDGMIYYDMANKATYSAYGNMWDFSEYADGYVLPNVGTAAPEILLLRKIKFSPAGKRLCDALNSALGYVYPTTPLNVFPSGRASGCLQVNTTFYFFYFGLVEN